MNKTFNTRFRNVGGTTGDCVAILVSSLENVALAAGIGGRMNKRLIVRLIWCTAAGSGGSRE